MGISNKYHCTVTHDIVDETGVISNGPAHEMNGGNYNGPNVTAVFTANGITGGPTGVIQAQMPDDEWLTIASIVQAIGEDVLTAPRFPVMRVRVLNNTGNTVGAFFATNAG